MHHDERLDVVVDLLGIGLDHADIIVFRELAERSPALRRTLPHLHHHRVHLPAEDVGQRSHNADDRPLRPRDARYEARQVVLERRLGAGREDAQCLLAVAAYRDDAEVDALSEGIPARLRLDAVALRPFLRVGIGLRVVLLDDESSAAGALVLLEEVAHLLRVCLERHRHLGGRGADVVLERHVLSELSEHGLGALRERVEALCGHVAAERKVREDHHGRRCDRADEDESDDALRGAAASVGDGLRRREHEHHHREVVADVRKVYDALAHRLEVREERAGRDRVGDRRGDAPRRDRADHRVEADDQEQEHERERHDESDDGRARQSGREHADRDCRAREEQRAEVAAENGAPVGRAEVACRESDGERQREADADEAPRGEELADENFGDRNRQREQKLRGAVASLVGPNAHRGGGNEQQVHPRMPEEERREVRLAALEEHRDAEGEESGEHEERR